MELRPYQEEAVQAIFGEWDKGRKKTLLVLPTGTGKTICFAKVIEEEVRRGKRTLMLAHRGELLQQAADKIEKVTGIKSAVEKAEQTSLESWYFSVVGSVQTLMRESRLKQFEPDYFDTIIVDEAHHSLADSYQVILDYFENANVLGVTATPDRGERQNLGKYFDSIAYDYSLPHAIKDGYLVPIKALTIPLELDLTGVGSQTGDYKVGELGTALDPYLEQIADEMAEICQDRHTLVFLPLIATSQKFTQILNDKGLSAREVNGESEDRAEILEAFNKKEFKVLCNSMLLTEGWDCPPVDCIVVLRPTKIRSLYAQMVGRGTRLNDRKEELLLLDFLWHTETHELCHPAHLVTDSPEVAARMTEIIADSNEAIDLNTTEEEAAQSVLEEREEALAKKLESMRRRKRRLVDPLQFEFSIMEEDLTGYQPAFGWEMQPPSASQCETLEKFGVNPEGVESAGKASLIIDKLMKRAATGLATPKQIRQLEQRGFRHVGQWTKDQAAKLIGQIAANSWRTPYSINPATYRPSGGAE